MLNFKAQAVIKLTIIGAVVCLFGIACNSAEYQHRHMLWLINATPQELLVRYSMDGKTMQTYVPNIHSNNRVELSIPVYASGNRVNQRWTKEQFDIAFDYIHVHKINPGKDTSEVFVDIKQFTNWFGEDSKIQTGNVIELGYQYKYMFDYIFP